MLYKIINFFEIMIYCQSNISESNAFYLYNRQHFFVIYIFSFYYFLFLLSVLVFSVNLFYYYNIYIQISWYFKFNTCKNKIIILG